MSETNQNQPSAARIAAALKFADAYAAYEANIDPTPALSKALEDALDDGDDSLIARTARTLHNVKKPNWDSVWNPGHDYIKLIATEAKGGAA